MIEKEAGHLEREHVSPTPRSAPEEGGRRKKSVEPSVWLDDLLSFFPLKERMVADMEPVAPEDIPEPYRGLLVHTHHMTVTLERFHGEPVFLRPQAVKRVGDDYARRLVLTAGKDGPVVLAGLMRFHLEYCDEEVRDEIVRARTPLGRILIEHGLMRRIQLDGCFRVSLANGLGEVFGAPAEATRTYGRLAVIFVEGKPAVELLEIVAPLPERRGDTEPRDEMDDREPR